MPSGLLSRSLIEIAADLRARRVTARELVEAAIGRHERYGERLHAYSLWAQEQALVVAQAADAAFAAGLTIGPLQGLPVSIKDLFAASGYPCFAGSSRRLPADPWERDGPLVATLRRQLGVIMGKTHMVEFAFGGTGHNSHWGAPYNPWELTGASRPRRFVERRWGQPVGRLRVARLRQRYCRFGADSGVHDRHCRPEGHARALADRGGGAAILDF